MAVHCLLLAMPYDAAADDALEGAVPPKGLSPTYPMARKEVNTDEYPWSAIGRVNVAGRSYCTGSLIGEATVVTAAHCLWNSETDRWFPPDYVHFVAGYQRDSYPAHSVAVKYYVPPEFKPEKDGESESRPSDWALIELEKPLGQSVGFLGWGQLDAKTFASLQAQKQTYLHAGYRRDRRHILSVDADCSLSEYLVDRSVVLHRCASIQGDSGGPLLLSRSGHYFVMGINVALSEHRPTSRKRTIAIPSVSFAEKLRAFGVSGGLVPGAPGITGRPGQLPESPKSTAAPH